MTNAMRNSRIEKLHFNQVINQIRDLPALPAIVHDLMKNISPDETDIHVITRKAVSYTHLTLPTIYSV